jgi:hypothetical protein
MFCNGRLVVVLILFLLLPLGCGSSGKNPNAPASVSGKITYKGQTLKGGTIAFFSKDATGTYSSGINSDGTYEIKDLPAGLAEVTIETESVNPNIKKQKYGQKGGSSPPPSNVQDKGPASAENYVRIPLRYGDRANSKLTMTLTAGNQTKDWELTD